MKSAQQVPHRLTAHTTSACCWELKTLRMIPSVWAEKGALLSAPILQGKGLRPFEVSQIPMRNSPDGEHTGRGTKFNRPQLAAHTVQKKRQDHRPFAATKSSASDSDTSNMRQELISPRTSKGRCWKVRQLKAWTVLHLRQKAQTPCRTSGRLKLLSRNGKESLNLT